MAINPYAAMMQPQQGFGGFGGQGFPQQGGFGGGMPLLNSPAAMQPSFGGIPNSFGGLNQLPQVGGSNLYSSMFGSPVSNAGVDPLLGQVPLASTGFYRTLLGLANGVQPWAAPSSYNNSVALPSMLGGVSVFGLARYFADIDKGGMPFNTPPQYGSSPYANQLMPQSNAFFNSSQNGFFGPGPGLGNFYG